MELIYGPVKSLRYGSTLGVNLLGTQKVCSYNCVYCDLGSSELTMNKIRKDYEFPTLEQIELAFKAYIKQSVETDCIVVSGNGEPTLYPHFDEAIEKLKHLRDEHVPGKKIVVLSNGAHLDNKKVVHGLNRSDERVIKIDAGSDTLLQKVNEPLVRINLAKFLNGLRKLNDCVVQALFFEGEITNASSEAVEEWIEIVGMVKPKGVQICTLTRPPRTIGLRPLDEDSLYGIAFKLKKRTGLESQVFPVQKGG